MELLPQLRPWSSTTGGRALHGFARGSGATARLVHGWAGRAADWGHLAGDLVDAGHHVVAVDLPAHGGTAGTTTDGFETAEALATVLRDERPHTVVVHSFGFPVLLRAIELSAGTRGRATTMPATIVALAPGRNMRHTLQRFAERSGLAPALTEELRRTVQSRFGADVWESATGEPSPTCGPAPPSSPPEGWLIAASSATRTSAAASPRR